MAVTHGGNIFSVASQEGVAWQQVLDFSASINPLGPSPAAREAIYSAVDRIAHYPERTSLDLRERLAGEWGVRPEQVMAGNGATELLFEWCRHFGTGTIAAPAFGEFHRAWPEARICKLAERDSWPEDGPVVLTRPANPTGHLVDAATVLRYSRERPGPVLVLPRGPPERPRLPRGPRLPGPLAPAPSRGVCSLRSPGGRTPPAACIKPRMSASSSSIQAPRLRPRGSSMAP